MAALGRFAAQSSDLNLNKTHVAVKEVEIWASGTFVSGAAVHHAYGLWKRMHLNSWFQYSD